MYANLRPAFFSLYRFLLDEKHLANVDKRLSKREKVNLSLEVFIEELLVESQVDTFLNYLNENKLEYQELKQEFEVEICQKGIELSSYDLFKKLIHLQDRMNELLIKAIIHRGE